jgi:hypothetical protein
MAGNYIPLKSTLENGTYTYWSGAYVNATGATGADGWLRASGLSEGWTDVTFFNTVGTDLTYSEGVPIGDNMYLSSGTAFTGLGDVRSDGEVFVPIESGYVTGVSGANQIQLTRDTVYETAIVAKYEGAGATHTGMIGISSTGTEDGFLSGTFLTRARYYNFDEDFETETGDLSLTGSGSGVYKGGSDITLQMAYVDRMGTAMTTAADIADNPFLDDISISIVTSNPGDMVYKDWRTNVLDPTVTLTDAEKRGIFGYPKKDVGFQFDVTNFGGEKHSSIFTAFANEVSIDKLYIQDANGTKLNEMSEGLGNVLPPNTDGLSEAEAQDAVKFFNGQVIDETPHVGSVNFTVDFLQDPLYAHFDSCTLFAKTGNELNFKPSQGNLVGTFGLDQIQQGQVIQLFQGNGLDRDVDIYFIMVLNNSITLEQTFINVGPVYLTVQDEVGSLPLFDYGPQTISDGNLTVAGDDAGYVTANCLIVGPSDSDYPNTLHTHEGHVGVGTATTLEAGAKMSVAGGGVVGIGVGNRLLGPGAALGGEYAQFRDLPGGGSGSGDLQAVTDLGATTTNKITCGGVLTPTDPVTVITDVSDNGGMGIYNPGATNKILTLKGDALGGVVQINDTAGVVSVKISNTATDGGQTNWYDGGGIVRMTALVDSNNQGELTLRDSSANDSIKLSSDSNKRGTLGVYDAAGTVKVEMTADSNDEGIMSIKDSLGNLATKVQANKSVISAKDSYIYSTGSVIVAGSGHIISGDYDVIAGGAKNDISGCDFAFVGGGSGVCINHSEYSSSVGGYDNDIVASPYGVIGGGFGNDIKGGQANTLMGGANNEITGSDSSFIGGGINQKLSGQYTFIGAGATNTAYADNSVIVGGVSNEVHGRYGAILGGGSNIVSGEHSVAMGRKAQVTSGHDGASVWADGQNRDHTSSGEHTLSLDFASGVYVPSTGFFNGLYVSGVPVSTGSAAEADTLQTVTDRGNTTTNSIEVAGKYLSGVTGVFSRDVTIANDLTVDTNTLFVDASEDRVGINESGPSYTLDVTASDASSLLSRFYNSSSTNGQGLLVRAGETSNANRIFQCSSRDDTKVMTVNSNGSVGVGTTAPYGRFDIVSSRNVESDLSDADNYHLHLHNNSDDTDESIGIGFGITSDTDAIGASIGHERKGPASFGDLFFATRPDGGSVTERLRIKSDGKVGIGTSNPANALDVVGHFSATSKSFVIDHPTKENKKLQYGSLEGPEHGVFVRGATSKNVIKLPDYWKDLVHEDSITVTLTPVHSFQSLYVKSKTPEQIMVGGVKKSYDYVVYAERKDIDKLEVEI